MCRYLVFATAFLLLTAESDAKTIDIGVGTVEIPKACRNELDMGLDSLVGKIECPGGLTINFDIGYLAGCYCDENCDPTRKTHPGFTFGRAQSELEGMSVCLQSSEYEEVLIANFVHVNFWAKVKSKKHVSTFFLIVASFDYKSNPKQE
jgi:hypothetical protein